MLLNFSNTSVGGSTTVTVNTTEAPMTMIESTQLLLKTTGNLVVNVAAYFLMPDVDHHSTAITTTTTGTVTTTTATTTASTTTVSTTTTSPAELALSADRTDLATIAAVASPFNKATTTTAHPTARSKSSAITTTITTATATAASTATPVTTSTWPGTGSVPPLMIRVNVSGDIAGNLSVFAAVSMQNDQIPDSYNITCYGYEPQSSWTIINISGVVHGWLAVSSTTCAGDGRTRAGALSAAMVAIHADIIHGWTFLNSGISYDPNWASASRPVTPQQQQERNVFDVTSILGDLRVSISLQNSKNAPQALEEAFPLFLVGTRTLNGNLIVSQYNDDVYPSNVSAILTFPRLNFLGGGLEVFNMGMVNLPFVTRLTQGATIDTQGIVKLPRATAWVGDVFITFPYSSEDIELPEAIALEIPLISEIAGSIFVEADGDRALANITSMPGTRVTGSLSMSAGTYFLQRPLVYMLQWPTLTSVGGTVKTVVGSSEANQPPVPVSMVRLVDVNKQICTCQPLYAKKKTLK